MNNRARAALEESILSWKSKLARAKAGKDFALGPEYCPLCCIFHPGICSDSAARGNCGGCPVQARTGRPFCRDTPYTLVADSETGTRKQIKAIEAEIAFLESLRPPV